MNPTNTPCLPVQLEMLRQIAESETGMDLSGTKQVRFSEAAGKAIQEGKTTDIDRALADPEQHNLLVERLTSALTVGESFFFRNEHHFRALREHAIPAIAEDNRRRREIRIWSAGCSTGEEPYSLAILLDQILSPSPPREQSDNRGDLVGRPVHAAGWSPSDRRSGSRKSDWSISILGTDINPHFLDRARQARYRDWSFRRTNIHQDATYFKKSGQKYQLVPRVRQCVRFAYLNLVKDVYPSALTGTLGLDLILFRNVAIYLRPDIVAAILSRFHQALRPGGWLLLGEAEVALAPRDHFDVVRFGAATFFRKPSGRTSCPAVPVLAAAPIVPIATRATLPTRAAVPPAPVSRPATAPAVATSPPVDEPHSVREQVDQYLLRREFAAAEKAVESISNRPERARARLACVRAILPVSSDFLRIREMLDRCLDEEPLLLEAQLLRASLAEEDNRLDEAETAFRRALYIDRRCAVAHLQLAMLLQQRGDTSAARKSLQSVLELAESRDPDALVEHGDGVCYGRLREMTRTMIDF